MSNEQNQNQEQPRKKSNRAAGKPSNGDGQTNGPKPEGRPTTRDGKPIRKTASGFTVVG